jgi:hypothetical protein
MARFIIGSLFLLMISADCYAQQQRPSIPLRDAHLSIPIRREIVSVVAKKLLSEDHHPTPEADILDFFVEYPHLAQDGSKTILVEEPSNPNPDIWLFSVSGAHVIPILADGGQGYGAWGKGFHHGMRDFQTTWITNMETGATKVLRFDGARYRPAYCSVYFVDEDGKLKNGPRGKCNKD